MGIGRKTLLAWGASLAVLAFGAPVFASGAHPGSLTAGPLTSNGSNTSNCKFYVNEIQVTSAPTFPMSQFTLAITVNDQTSGTWFFPDPSQVSNNPQALPKVEIKEGALYRRDIDPCHGGIAAREGICEQSWHCPLSGRVRLFRD